MWCKLALLVPVIGLVSTEPSWELYKEHFKKNYSTPEEESARKRSFLEEMKEISQHVSPYGIRLENNAIFWNQFSDFTGKEFVERFGLRIETPANHTSRTGIHNVTGEELPYSIDWSEYVPDAKDPGQCVSSFAFVAAWAVESHHYIKKGKKGPHELSVQQIMDCSHRRFGNGNCTSGQGLLDNTFRYIKFWGLWNSSAYPYVGRDESCHAVPWEKRPVIITGYTEVRPFSEGDLQDAVGRIGPVAVYINLVESLKYFFGKRFFSDHPNHCRPTSGNRSVAVLVVGYGRLAGWEYWKIKSPWGSKWGKNGYALLPRNKNNYCGIANRMFYPTSVS